ncbi:MAG: site-2 protease family protein [bacterium]
MFSNLSVVNISVILFTIFISTALHEMMHAYVALKLGDDLAYSRGRITLNPMSHIDPILTVALPLVMLLMGLSPILAAKPVPINVSRVRGHEMGMALIGIAGPLTNLAIAIIAGTVLRFVQFDGFIFDFLATLFTINISLFVFNMIPFPPLDGSRVLYAFAPEPVQRVMEQIEGFGVFGVILLVTFLSPVIGPVLDSVRASLAHLIIG